MGADKTVENRGGFIDLKGQVFNWLEVISFAGRKNRRTYWECICKCGKKKIVEAYTLKMGRTKSCGCWMQTHSGGNTKHGLSQHRLYAVWRSMLARCNNPKNRAYPIYGGRGIVVCDRWHDFESFFIDLNEEYKNGLTLERINTDGNYELSNIKWDTYKNQARNKRNNHIIQYNGDSFSVAEMAEKYNIPAKLLYRRISEGWSINRVIETPIDFNKINFPKRKRRNK